MFDISDPRHIGRLDAIGSIARVTFIETGWRGEIALGDLRKADAP